MGNCVQRHYEEEHLTESLKAVFPPASSGLAQGVDVSQWQGYPNWGEARESGLRFVYSQATYGVSYEPGFGTNAHRQASAHLANGAYTYLEPGCAPAATVAHAFVANVDGQGVGFNSLPPALDQETNGCLPHNEEIARFDCEVANDIRRLDGWSSVVLYAARWLVSGIFHSGNTCGLLLWVASWGPIELPAGWSHAVAWQFCGVGCYFAGIGGQVDRDASLGILSYLRHKPPPPKPTKGSLERQLKAHKTILGRLRVQLAHIRAKLQKYGCARRRHRHEQLGPKCAGWFAVGDSIHRRGDYEDRVIREIEGKLRRHEYR
jgi:GH25 family lysozyme M1 (1,4-beta-N-acetylmuramidase)